ncbi:hypothetical protein Q1695_012764 [Nippostrongylus brasiliensis]|nr:hypothetical protein Q1695_012764 [Nippostrongylus brasiliensis]
MQPSLTLLPVMFVLVHSLYYEWPTREFNKLRPEATAQHQSWRRSSSSPLFARERRANNLCGKRFIEHLLILCNSCILPAGSEIIKRVAHEQNPRQRLIKRELSISEKCCAGQCKMSELERLCCSKG